MTRLTLRTGADYIDALWGAGLSRQAAFSSRLETENGLDPTGMVDSATDVLKQAQAALAASPIYALRILQVEKSGSTLLISGRVSTFYYKQLAQEVVRAATHDVQLVNQIDVE